MNHKVIIGLEVHVELKTQSKMFCGCSTKYFGENPNIHTCPVCLGLPGALPVPNKQAIEWCIQIGQALNCQIPLFSKFDRKNYFYPDLPKGYQISQYDQPFCVDGSIEVNGKKIRIRRVHMEEDTGKLIHENSVTLIDFNRSGVPLVEIVTEPDFDNAQDVKLYLQKIQKIVRYLGVSDADMEKGQMRLEPNISISLNVKDNTLPKYKVEVKNINSFSFVEKAINFELQRQLEILKNNQIPTQETRGWDEKKGQTISQRIKEEANDYRYFPEPDIPPLRFTKNQIDQIKQSMPELPDQIQLRFQSQYNLSLYDSEILTKDTKLAKYFEEVVKISENQLTAKQIANYIINKKVDIVNVLPATLIKNIQDFSKVDEISEDELKQIIVTVIKNNPKIKKDYEKGKQNVIQFAIGQVMYALKRKIDTEIVKQLILKELR